MMTTATLSAKDVGAAIRTFGGLLASHREVINRLNVFPVPDGDTGTNMALTVESVIAELDGSSADDSLASVARAIAHGSLMGARGNSGVILSQLLRGLVADFSGESVSPQQLAGALERADELARQAVARPLEGTILSVARAGAKGARAHDADLVALVRGARDEAREALAHTPEQLPVLKEAGVVDSGGSGLVLFFDSLCHVVAGDPLPEAPALNSLRATPMSALALDSALSDLRYEVMYLLDADDTKMHAFREVWEGIGDSIVIVGGDGLYNCHIHTDDVGAAIEAALDAGRPRQIKVTDLAEQVLEERWVREAHANEEPASDEPAPLTSVVAVVVGQGIGRIFHSLGVHQLVQGGQSMNPSTADLVDAVRASGSAQIVILPNNKNVIAVAEQVDALVEQRVLVVATTSIVEGFAALLNYDPDATAEENQSAMRASACNVVAGEVTRAVRDTTTAAGPVHVGDWIGLGHEGVLSVADSLVGASAQLLERLIRPEHELLTIIEGDGSSPADTRRLKDLLGEEYPNVALEVHHGGQPLYPYYFGLE
ncbi:MAG TPA: DAK2 domain-containing protein [Acidimicrobiales bacterium]|nr:DAK2 domain-containing protein [Acidimicrobiales bacterium]